MKYIERLLYIKKDNKIISLEYLLGVIVSLSLWVYHLIKAAIISQNLAKESMFN